MKFEITFRNVKFAPDGWLEGFNALDTLQLSCIIFSLHFS